MMRRGRNQALRQNHHGPAFVKKKRQDTHYLRLGNLSRADRILYVDGGYGSEGFYTRTHLRGDIRLPLST